MRDKRADIISHPGEILKEDFLDDLGISVYALANAINVPRSRMNDIVLGRRGITADTAVRLGKFFGVSPQNWMHLQSRYDQVMAESRLETILPTLQTLEDISAQH